MAVESVRAGRAPVDIGGTARRWTIGALKIGGACVLSAILGLGAYIVFGEPDGAYATAESFLDAMRMGDASAMMSVAQADPVLPARADDLLARLPDVSTYELGPETRIGSVSRIPAELVGSAAGRPVAGVGRQRVLVTMTLVETRGVWRVDAERFFKDAYAAALPDGLTAYDAILGNEASRDTMPRDGKE